jgi:hypothetical protein
LALILLSEHIGDWCLSKRKGRQRHGWQVNIWAERKKDLKSGKEEANFIECKIWNWAILQIRLIRMIGVSSSPC